MGLVILLLLLIITTHWWSRPLPKFDESCRAPWPVTRSHNGCRSKGEIVCSVSSTCETCKQAEYVWLFKHKSCQHAFHHTQNTRRHDWMTTSQIFPEMLNCPFWWVYFLQPCFELCCYFIRLYLQFLPVLWRHAWFPGDMWRNCKASVQGWGNWAMSFRYIRKHLSRLYQFIHEHTHSQI